MTSTYTGTRTRMVSMYKAPKQGGRRHPDEYVADLLIAVLKPTVPLSGAACTGHPELFDLDSTPEQHEEAAQICSGCSVAQRCAEWSAEQRKNVSGVVAGSLMKGPYFRSGRQH